MIDYAKADEAFPFDIKLFADNEDFHHSMTWFFTLIGKNVFVSTEIVGGITELKYFWIDRRNETDYIKPMYMVSFYKSDRDRQGDNLFDNGLISVAISSDNETYNNEFIIKKNSSIVYWASGLKDELDCHEKEIIDYNKIKPVRYSIPKNPLRF